MISRIVNDILQYRRLVGIWALTTAFTALTGPFGTYVAMGLVGRAGYWGVVVAVALATGVWIDRWLSTASVGVALLGRLAHAFGLTIVILLLNEVVFGGWLSLREFAYVFGLVVGVSVVIEGVERLFGTHAAADAAGDDPRQPAPSPEARFLERLPFDKREALVRIEAQDHYLNIVTERGSDLLLMRMADAEQALHDANGLRVHRSHWVAVPGVLRHLRRDGRDFLETTDGAQVPVSRKFRADVQGAGLIATR